MAYLDLICSGLQTSLVSRNNSLVPEAAAINQILQSSSRRPLEVEL
jgi:hypothetical protein